MRILIKNATIVTMNSRREVIADGHVLVDGPCIARVGEGPSTGIQADKVIDANRGIVLPGFVNMHQHLHMNLLKGLADGLLLEPWAFGFSSPARGKVTPEMLVAANQLAALEMLRTGTTCVLNHQTPFEFPEYPDLVVRDLGRLGLRQVMALAFQCRTPKMPDHPHTAVQAREAFAALARRFDAGPGALTRIAMVIECNAHHTQQGRSSDELVMTGHELARELGMRIAVHVSGGTLAMHMGFTKYRRETGRSDVMYLERLGVMDPSWILKHGIHFSDEDIETVAARGACVVYTPTSEAVRGGGIGPWKSMLQSGILCALGTDGPAVDYTVDMLEQVRATRVLQSVRYGHPGAIDDMAALEMATINGARALGLDGEIGSLETGKRADLVMFRLDRPHQRQIEDPIRRLVWSARGSEVDMVMVDGRLVVNEGQFEASVDSMKVMENAQEQSRILTRQARLDWRTKPQWTPARRPELFPWTVAQETQSDRSAA